MPCPAPARSLAIHVTCPVCHEKCSTTCSTAPRPVVAIPWIVIGALSARSSSRAMTAQASSTVAVSAASSSALPTPSRAANSPLRSRRSGAPTRPEQIHWRTLPCRCSSRLPTLVARSCGRHQRSAVGSSSSARRRRGRYVSRSSATHWSRNRTAEPAGALTRRSRLLELDHLHGAALGRLADLRLVAVEVRPVAHRRALVRDVEHLGAGVLAQVAADAAFLDPHLLDGHGALPGRGDSFRRIVEGWPRAVEAAPRLLAASAPARLRGVPGGARGSNTP